MSEIYSQYYVKFEPMQIISKAILDARYEIMAQEDQAIFDILDSICSGIYDWAFYE